MTDGADARSALLRAQDVTEDELASLRSGTIPPRLLARVRSGGTMLIVLALLGLGAMAFLIAAAMGTFGPPDWTLGLGAPFALGFAIWALYRALLRLTDTAIETVETMPTKLESHTSRHDVYWVHFGAFKVKVSAYGLSNTTYGLIREDVTARAFFARRSKALLAVEQPPRA